MMHGTAKCDRTRAVQQAGLRVCTVCRACIQQIRGQHMWTIAVEKVLQVTVLSLRTNLQLVMLAVAIALELSCLG